MNDEPMGKLLRMPARPSLEDEEHIPPTEEEYVRDYRIALPRFGAVCVELHDEGLFFESVLRAIVASTAALIGSNNPALKEQAIKLFTDCLNSDIDGLRRRAGLEDDENLPD
jgi:hypothetical protein